MKMLILLPDDYDDYDMMTDILPPSGPKMADMRKKLSEVVAIIAVEVSVMSAERLV